MNRIIFHPIGQRFSRPFSAQAQAPESSIFSTKEFIAAYQRQSPNTKLGLAVGLFITSLGGIYMIDWLESVIAPVKKPNPELVLAAELNQEEKRKIALELKDL